MMVPAVATRVAPLWMLCEWIVGAKCFEFLEKTLYTCHSFFFFFLLFLVDEFHNVEKNYQAILY